MHVPLYIDISVFGPIVKLIYIFFKIYIFCKVKYLKTLSNIKVNKSFKFKKETFDCKGV